MKSSFATRDVASATRRTSSRWSVHPVAKLPRLPGGIEDEHRRTLHAVARDGARDPARQVEHLHPAVVGGDERALGGREGDEELALRVLAVHPQRPREPDRDLRHAAEVLDVAPGHLGIERVGRHVVQRDTSGRLDVAAAGVRHGPGVIVALVLVVGDARALRRRRRRPRRSNRILGLHRHGAERRGLQHEGDGVRSRRQRVGDCVDAGTGAPGERQRVLRRDRQDRQDLAGGKFESELRGGDFATIHHEAGQSRHDRVAQPVLNVKVEAVRFVPERAGRVQLPRRR